MQIYLKSKYLSTYLAMRLEHEEAVREGKHLGRAYGGKVARLEKIAAKLPEGAVEELEARVDGLFKGEAA